MPDDVARGQRDAPDRVDPPQLIGADSWDELTVRERRLAEAAALVNTLLQAAPVGFGFVDRDLRFQRVNRELARFAGHTVESLRGCPVETTAFGTHTVAPAMRSVLATGDAVIDLPVRDGARHLLFSLFPVDNAKGERAGIGVLALDVTDRARFIQRLQALADAAVGMSSLSVDEVLSLVSERVSAILDAARVVVTTTIDSGSFEGSGDWLMAPLVGRRGRRIGLIRVAERRDGRDFDEADEATLVQLARFASIAIENARLHRETERAERRYRSLVESSSELLFVVDAEGLCQQRSESWEEFTGQFWPEYQGRNWLERYHPEDRERVAGEWAHAIARGSFFATDARLWHAPSGAYRHIRLQAAPVRDSDGAIEEWMSTADDIEDRVQAQRLEEAQRIAGYGSFTVDVATEWVSVSREVNRIAGLPLDNPGFTLDEALALLLPHDRPSVEDAIVQLEAGRPMTVDDGRLVRADGSVRVVVASAEPVLDATGRVVALHGTVRDVTEERAIAAFQRERRIVVALQEALLPERLPDVPGLDIAAQYRAASDTAVGGDWYDAFVLPDGKVAFVIGDVTGHGVTSAAAMSQVRTALRAYALEGHAPARVLALLDRVVVETVPDAFVTVILAMHDPGNGSLRMARAGHPLPLLRTARTVEVLDVPGAPPLGTGYAARQREHELALPPAAELVLYTDGLVERRGASIDEGVARACAALRRSDASSAAALCGVLVDSCVDARTADDVAVLVIRRLGSSPTGASSIGGT